MTEEHKPEWPMTDRRASDPNIRDLQEKVGKILDRLTKLETILEMRADFDKRLRELETGHAVCRRQPVEDYEHRIRDLEQKYAEMKGRASVLGCISGAGVSILISVVAALIIWAVKG